MAKPGSWKFVAASISRTSARSSWLYCVRHWDCIKITEVRDRNDMLRNTFLEPFKPVPGMSQVYRAWAERTQAQFDYVSASPWQLFLPLSEFVRSNGFPAGTFYLKNFRLKDKSFRSLFQDPEKYKPAVIEPLLKQFPNR